MNSLNLILFLSILLFISNLHSQNNKHQIILAKSETLYNEYLDKYEVYHGMESVRLKQYGKKVIDAFNRLAISTGYTQNQIDQMNWEFEVVDMNGSRDNFIVLPGGKVLVSLEMFSVANSEAKIIWFISHGVAHSFLEGNEESALKYLGLNSPTGFTELKEKEADKWGAIIMAIAGYDPMVGVEIWEDLEQRNIGYKDSHPFYEGRYLKLQQLANEAKTRAKEKYGMRFY